jgi:hypothetical protein
VAAVLAGGTYGPVAKDHGVSSSLVHETLIAAGSCGVRSKKNADRDAAIIKLWEAGKSEATIADEVGLSQNRVRLIIAAKECVPIPNRTATRAARAKKQPWSSGQAIEAELTDHAEVLAIVRERIGLVLPPQPVEA